MPRKITINDAHNLAKQKNGKCLSTAYVNIDSKLKWECHAAHHWDASYYNVEKNGSWCPHCAGIAKLSLDAMKKLAGEKNGKCLSTTYINSNEKLLWECEFGHQWEALPSPIRSKGVWCPTCAGKKRRTITDMYELAANRKGKCLSTEYKNNRSKLQWECKLGHRWEAVPSSIVNSETWCPDCAGNKKLEIEDMIKLAGEKNGKCLSKEYLNTKEKLIWQCEHGHQWNALACDVKDGKWCPDCYRSKRKGENAVRKFFEKLFNNKFPSSRPSWLIYEGQKLELDGYCKELKLAFEYQGKYHFDKKAYWYPDKTTSFERRQIIDAYKVQVCNEQKIRLIHIDELNPRKNPQDWKDKIKDIFISNNIDIPKNYNDIPFGSVEFHTSNNHTQEAHEIAKLRKGTCHSKNVLYRSQLVEWECYLGHRWTASLSQVVLKNTWCLHCAGKAKLTIEQMQELAQSKKGKCLSTIYVNANKRLQWMCHLGHQWEAIPSSIINNRSWCPDCAGNTILTIKDMQKKAKEKNGECLSNKYKGSKKKLIWKCESGHVWEATPSAICNNGTWCPTCGGSEKLTIEHMREIAKHKGGKCVSEEYINARTKLLWMCSEGHTWLAVPDKIKNLGRWCKQCK